MDIILKIYMKSAILLVSKQTPVIPLHTDTRVMLRNESCLMNTCFSLGLPVIVINSRKQYIKPFLSKVLQLSSRHLRNIMP